MDGGIKMTELDIIRNAANLKTGTLKKGGYRPTGFYVYTDEAGNILYVRLRMDHPNGKKWIRPLSRDKDGNWTIFKEPSFENGKPLYNLQEIKENPNALVFVVEGEKCADALNKLGILATTSGAANSAKDANWQPLAEREIIIWPDNDKAGKDYANDVARELQEIAQSTQRIDVERLSLNSKGDCIDWIKQFIDANGVEPTSADVMNLECTKDVIQIDLAPNQYTFDNSSSVILKCASDIDPKPVKWIWDGWLAKGKLHIFAGQAGTGKTTIAISMASTITTGGRFPDGSQSEKGSVLIWSGEDSPADTLVPRLMAARADLSKVYFVSDTFVQNELRGFDPAIDMQALMHRAASIPDLALMIIDPIVNAVAGDSHKNGEVRRALQPVVDFAERLQCALLGITHFSKGGQGKEPLERVTGSIAYAALARIVLSTAKINDGEKSKRIVFRLKSNLGVDHGGFEYDLQEKEVKSGIFNSFALWGNAVEGNATELLAEPDNRYQGQDGNSALGDAKEFLIELLSQGELPQQQIQLDAKGAGVSWRTVERAKKALYVKSSRSVTDKKWYWRLPNN